MPATSLYTPVTTMRDFDPFCVDPLMRWLHRKQVPEIVVVVSSFVLIACILVVAALASHGGLWSVRAGRSTVADLRSIVSTPRVDTLGSNRVPLLRDYPSLLTAFSIACAPGIVYTLFNTLGRMHSSLARNDCLEVSKSVTKVRLEHQVDVLNADIANYGRWRRVVAISLCCLLPFVLVSVFKLHNAGFSYLVNPHTPHASELTRQLYDNWWARFPRPGFFAWCGLGAFGIYMTYVEAIVGIRYVSFLFVHRNDYHFRANIYNVDNHYGWASLRRTFTIMITGIATSAFSFLPIYLFLKPALHRDPVVALMIVYTVLVLYVPIASAIILSRSVRKVKELAIRHIATELKTKQQGTTLEVLMQRQLLLSELDVYHKIPDFPVLSRWSALAAGVTAAGVIASATQVYSVVR